jgi:hypothetical protein
MAQYGGSVHKNEKFSAQCSVTATEHHPWSHKRQRQGQDGAHKTEKEILHGDRKRKH